MNQFLKIIEKFLLETKDTSGIVLNFLENIYPWLNVLFYLC